MMYRQCVLERENTSREKTQMVTWLPEEFAVVGRVLKLRKRIENGCIVDYTEWVDGWKVVSVGEALVHEHDLNENEHKYHRDVKMGRMVDNGLLDLNNCWWVE